MTIKSTKALCFWCKHLNVENGRWAGSQASCSAFPDGIPEVIWDLRFDHRYPYEGDNDIQFEKVANYDNMVDTMRNRLTDEQLDLILNQMIQLVEHFRRRGEGQPPLND